MREHTVWSVEDDDTDWSVDDEAVPSILNEPMFPEVHVRITGEDGNAMNVIGKVVGALRKGGATEKQREAFCAQAMSGDYNHLLVTCCKWVGVS